jgi:hypothetical protein
MADVRGQRIDLLLVAVKADCVVATALVDPEVTIEPGTRNSSASARRRPASGASFSGPSAISAIRVFASYT